MSDEKPEVCEIAADEKGMLLKAEKHIKHLENQLKEANAESAHYIRQCDYYKSILNKIIS